jgi:hypothetical protein
MGFARKRVNRNGRTRYTATYVDLRGSIRSAGTFSSERAADKAWQKAEVELRQGRVGDPARGRQTFQRYVEERWLPNHVLEPTTREKYTYYLGAYIFPELGRMRMADIFPEHIRAWITRMQREQRSAWTIQYCKTSILSSIFTTALNGLWCPSRRSAPRAGPGRARHAGTPGRPKCFAKQKISGRPDQRPGCGTDRPAQAGRSREGKQPQVSRQARPRSLVALCGRP